jgi:hypothetical protein
MLRKSSRTLLNLSILYWVRRKIVVEIYEIIGDKLVLRSIYGNIKEPLPYEYIQSIDEGVIGRAIKERKGQSISPILYLNLR